MLRGARDCEAPLKSFSAAARAPSSKEGPQRAPHPVALMLAECSTRFGSTSLGSPMRDVHGLAAGRNEFRARGAAASRLDALAVPGLNCDLFRNARAIRAVSIEFCDLSTLTAVEAVHLIAKGELRAEEYALRLLERQRALQSLHAVTWLDEERVVESARAIDSRRERGEPLGMLGGLPVIIKD